MRRSLLIMSLLLALTAAGTVRAQGERVDDSASQVLGSTLKLRWDDAIPAPGARSTMSGTITVRVRLDTRPWRGQRIRIYQVLEATQTSRVHVAWTSQGPLLPGQMQSGERSLVYAGPIDVDLLQDTFVLTVQATGDGLDRQELLKFTFEMEPE
jgi:hypothetical protein